jgi:hypothetical protein
MTLNVNISEVCTSPTGLPGILIVPGATGPIGATGLAGPTGSLGPQGTYGATGVQGPAGAASYNVTAIQTSDYTASINDLVRTSCAGGSGFSVFLPAISSGNSGKAITVKNVIGGGNGLTHITITPNGSDTIDGASTFTSVGGPSKGSVVLISDGSSNWMACSGFGI